MLLAFHQPNYLPNPGFFYKMAQVDIFVIVTNVQFVRREWHNRANIRWDNSDLLLTVPVMGSNRQMIREAMIDSDMRWRRKLLRTLESVYGSTAEANLLNGFLEIHKKPIDRLVDLNIQLILRIKEQLGIRTELVVDEEVDGKRDELLINICRKYGADRYLSGLGGKNYMDKEFLSRLEENRISHTFVERNVTGTYPYSSLHYMLTEGLESAKRIAQGDDL